MLPICIVLDLDDTLYLERDYVMSGFDAVGALVRDRLGIRDFADRAKDHFDAGRRRDIFNVVLREYGFEPRPDHIQELVNAYRVHTPRIRLLPDASEFLARFRGLSRLALISDGFFESQRRKIRSLGLHYQFDVMALTGAWGPHFAKPSIQAFQFVQSKMGSHGSHYVYIADNPTKDFQAPKVLGWSAVRVRRVGGVYSHLENPAALTPDFEVDNLEQIVELLARGGIGRPSPSLDGHEALRPLAAAS